MRWYSVTLPRMPWVANVRLKVNPMADASTLQGRSAHLKDIQLWDLPGVRPYCPPHPPPPPPPPPPKPVSSVRTTLWGY